MKFNKAFEDFIRDKMYKEIETLFENRVCIYSNGTLYFRFVTDYNNNVNVDISNIGTPVGANGWFQIEIIRSMILNNEDYFIGTLTLDDACNYIVDNYVEIQRLFSPPVYPTTVKIAEEMRERRGQYYLSTAGKNPI